MRLLQLSLLITAWKKREPIINIRFMHMVWCYFYRPLTHHLLHAAVSSGIVGLICCRQIPTSERFAFLFFSSKEVKEKSRLNKGGRTTVYNSHRVGWKISSSAYLQLTSMQAVHSDCVRCSKINQSISNLYNHLALRDHCFLNLSRLLAEHNKHKL